MIIFSSEMLIFDEDEVLFGDLVSRKREILDLQMKARWPNYEECNLVNSIHLMSFFTIMTMSCHLPYSAIIHETSIYNFITFLQWSD